MPVSLVTARASKPAFCPILKYPTKSLFLKMSNDYGHIPLNKPKPLLYVAIAIVFAILISFLRHILLISTFQADIFLIFLYIFMYLFYKYNLKRYKRYKKEILERKNHAKWICPKCSKENSNQSFSCRACHHKLI